MNASLGPQLYPYPFTDPDTGDPLALLATLSLWLRECFRGIPLVIIKSKAQHVSWDAKQSAPLSHCHRLTVKRENSIRGRVVHLLYRGFPSAIFWRVGSVVINATQRVFPRWRFAYIRSEVLKRISPAVAHSDATPTVLRIFQVFLSVASVFRSTPHGIQSGIAASVRANAIAGDDASAATAPARFAAYQVAAIDGFRHAANTPADVICRGAASFGRARHEPITKGHSELNKHTWHYMPMNVLRYT